MVLVGNMYLPRVRKFWSAGVGHLTNDIFMSAGIVLLTFLSSTILPMSNTQIGLAISLKQLAGAISQPFFGMRADRRGGRWIGAGGLAWVVVTFMLALVTAIVTQNYVLMLIPFVLQGLGSGALHPVGALHAAEADEDRSATNTAYFFLMGQTGLALGPAIVGYLLDAANPTPIDGSIITNPNFFPIFMLGLFAIPSIIFMFTGIPALREKAKTDKKKKRGDEVEKTGFAVIAPFLIIAAIVIFRSLASPGSVNFIPVLFDQKGWSPTSYGAITSVFWIASGLSGVFFGNLADKFDRRYIIMASMVLSAPAYFFLPLADGFIAVILAIVAGGFGGGAHSIIVVLAQELAPDSKGFATGAILGFIFGMGALGSLAIGAISDMIGLGLTFQIVAFSAAVSGLLGLLLPKRVAD